MDWSNLISAVIGAIVGGAIAYLMQIRALREARAQRKEDRADSQKALGLSLLFKLSRIYTSVHWIHDFFETQLKVIADTKLVEPWQVMQFLPNPPDPVTFTSDEMAMLLGLKSNELFNRMTTMDVAHKGVIDAIKKLNSERELLAERMPPGAFEGDTAHHQIGKEQFARLRPLMISVNTLTTGTRDAASQLNTEAYAALPEFNDLLRDRLGLTQTITLLRTPADAQPASGAGGRSTKSPDH